MQASFCQALFKMPIRNVPHVWPLAFGVREQPLRLRLAFRKPPFFLLPQVFFQHSNQLVRKVDASNLLRFCWNDLSMCPINASLDNDVLAVEINVTTLEAREFSCTKSGMDRHKE